ncbi:hypothetical protein P3X46_030509 [Hevea brasiliensis]|uniref:pyruvate kinase n=1 Tax=Hevea brasiliensis TaxID=3981 RepID=A0ABQ9KHH5_HEVBR|nr:hypothetical protein P3X46_030509 [Hevea brasiliensis]
MAQVVATRSIHSSLLCPSSGSLQERVDKLKPSSFASKVLASEENKREKNGLKISRRYTKIAAAKRSVRAEPEVIPVSPEDVPQLAEAGMNVARLNMSHGDHASHQKVIDLVKEYNSLSKDNVIAIMLDTKAGGMMSLLVKSKTDYSVKCEVVDGELKSRRHLNVRGKSVTLPSINGCGADIHVIVKIESADSIPNLHSIITASDGAMVARGDLGAELPIEEVPLLQEEIIRLCQSMGKAVIVATNMLESMIVHPTPTRAEVSDIARAVREGADAVMLSGETAHGKFPLKAVKVMRTVALQTVATIAGGVMPPNLGQAFKNHMSEMFAYHATMMSNTLGTSIVVFTRTGFMTISLSHYRPSGTIFAFTNEKRIQQRLALYQGICPIYMQFSDDAEETFANALSVL